MRILIATGVYPPAIGGPAQYAKNLKEEWERTGFKVKVKTFRLEHSLPSGVRHFYFFLKILPAVLWSDFIFALDTFSVGWPATCAAKIFGKKIIIRTGGDFLWEGYVERSRDKVLLRDFYKTTRETWSWKERLIFKITKWTLHHVSAVIFSTKWQRDIWSLPYGLERIKVFFVENYYGSKEKSFKPTDKEFIASTRPLVWKNLDVLKGVGVKIHLGNSPYKEFMDKLAHAYAVILVSLGDISPNLILDAIRYNKAFIITEENGLMDRIGGIALTVNPKDVEDIKNKILWFSDEENYMAQVEKVKNFHFTHSWGEIAREIIEIWKKV